MSPPYTYIADLAQEAEPPADGILSRTLYNDEYLKAVIFGFGVGQELSEHTSTMPATLQFLSGEATLTLGDDTFDARPGTFVHMPAGLRHGIRAKTPTNPSAPVAETRANLRVNGPEGAESPSAVFACLGPRRAHRHRPVRSLRHPSPSASQ